MSTRFVFQFALPCSSSLLHLAHTHAYTYILSVYFKYHIKFNKFFTQLQRTTTNCAKLAKITTSFHACCMQLK